MNSTSVAVNALMMTTGKQGLRLYLLTDVNVAYTCRSVM